MCANLAEEQKKKKKGNQRRKPKLGLKFHFEGTAKGRKNGEQKVKSVKSQKET